MIKTLLFCLLMTTCVFTCAAQDTVYTKHVKVAVPVYAYNGRLERLFFKNVKVKSGYIIKYSDSTALINNRRLKSKYFKR